MYNCSIYIYFSISIDLRRLYQSPQGQTGTVDLHKWLHSSVDEANEDKFNSQTMKILAQMSRNTPPKTIDSRTYTRPKKRYSRPSIETYNEGLFDFNSTQNNASLVAAKLQEMELDQDDGYNSQPKPLNFDLSQPTSTSIFDKILAEVPGADSFQNMSPPSLMNSMCSSTFTTLMESSYIKNDPVLREIRDTDYSDTVLLQDGDPTTFQSITESLIKRALQESESLEAFKAEEKQEADSGSTPVENLSCRLSETDLIDGKFINY